MENPFVEILERLDRIESEISKQSTQTEPVKEQSDYISRKQLKECWGISYPTIHKYMREGILNAYHLGGKTMFKKNEVESALKPVNYSINQKSPKSWK